MARFFRKSSRSVSTFPSSGSDCTIDFKNIQTIMASLTFWIDEFYDLPETMQRDFIENKITVIREWIVFVFLDEKEYDEIDLDTLF